MIRLALSGHAAPHPHPGPPHKGEGEERLPSPLWGGVGGWGPHAPILLVATLLLLLAAPAWAVSSPAEMLPDRAQELRAEAIGHQLRCLVCQNESVEDSDADLARDLRHIIRTRVSAGDSDQQVMDWMVARYGDFVRLKPPFDAQTLVLWFAPLLALLVGAGAVFLSRRRRPEPAAPLSGDERRRLAELTKP